MEFRRRYPASYLTWPGAMLIAPMASVSAVAGGGPGPLFPVAVFLDSVEYAGLTPLFGLLTELLYGGSDLVWREP